MEFTDRKIRWTLEDFSFSHNQAIPWVKSTKDIAWRIRQRRHASSASPSTLSTVQLAAIGHKPQFTITIIVRPVTLPRCLIFEPTFQQEWWDILGQSRNNIAREHIDIQRESWKDCFSPVEHATLSWDLCSPIFLPQIHDGPSFDFYTSSIRGCRLHSYFNTQEYDYFHDCCYRIDPYQFHCTFL